MPRTPDVCPRAFCSLVKVSSKIRGLLSVFGQVLISSDSRFFQLVLPLLFLFLPAQAQSTTVTLRDAAMDHRGITTPVVNIAAVHVAQHFQRSMTSNGDGVFVLSLLPQSNCIVKAKTEDFSPAEPSNVILNVNVPMAIIGNIVHVSRLIALMLAVNTLINQQFVSNLPLNDRHFQCLPVDSVFSTANPLPSAWNTDYLVFLLVITASIISLALLLIRMLAKDLEETVVVLSKDLQKAIMVLLRLWEEVQRVRETPKKTRQLRSEHKRDDCLRAPDRSRDQHR